MEWFVGLRVAPRIGGDRRVRFLPISFGDCCRAAAVERALELIFRRELFRLHVTFNHRVRPL